MLVVDSVLVEVDGFDIVLFVVVVVHLVVNVVVGMVLVSLLVANWFVVDNFVVRFLGMLTVVSFI